jgi:hypothetical protein
MKIVFSMLTRQPVTSSWHILYARPIQRMNERRDDRNGVLVSFAGSMSSWRSVDPVAAFDRLAAVSLRVEAQLGVAIRDTELAHIKDREKISPSLSIRSGELDSRAARAGDRLGVGAAES